MVVHCTVPWFSQQGTEMKSKAAGTSMTSYYKKSLLLLNHIQFSLDKACNHPASQVADSYFQGNIWCVNLRWKSGRIGSQYQWLWNATPVTAESVSPTSLYRLSVCLPLLYLSGSQSHSVLFTLSKGVCCIGLEVHYLFCYIALNAILWKSSHPHTRLQFKITCVSFI